MSILQEHDFRDHVYLGDGVYACNDGYQIWLAVMRDGVEMRIALEPAVFEKLLVYRQRLLDLGKEPLVSPTGAPSICNIPGCWNLAEADRFQCSVHDK